MKSILLCVLLITSPIDRFSPKAERLTNDKPLEKVTNEEPAIRLLDMSYDEIKIAFEQGKLSQFTSDSLSEIMSEKYFVILEDKLSGNPSKNVFMTHWDLKNLRLAIKNELDYEIPAKICLTQKLFEARGSNSIKSRLYRDYNNCFGIIYVPAYSEIAKKSPIGHHGYSYAHFNTIEDAYATYARIYLNLKKKGVLHKYSHSPKYWQVIRKNADKYLNDL